MLITGWVLVAVALCVVSFGCRERTSVFLHATTTTTTTTTMHSFSQGPLSPLDVTSLFFLLLHQGEPESLECV